MKTLWLMVTLMVLVSSQISAQREYTTKTARITFYAKAPITDVNAENNLVKVELNTSTNDVMFTMNMEDFKFKNQKMGRDAQTKYLETDKYKQASFKGKIKGTVDYRKVGSYPVTASGKMKIHGVERDVNEPGTVIVDKTSIKLQSEFYIKLQDYQVETPKILGQKMTEENVLIKVDATILSGTKNVITKK